MNLMSRRFFILWLAVHPVMLLPLTKSRMHLQSAYSCFFIRLSSWLNCGSFISFLEECWKRFRDDAYPLAASNLRITKQGFQFLVCDLRTQLWTLLLQYVELAERLHLDRVDMLHLFLQLGLLQVGQEYAMEGLKEQQLCLLNDLCYIGLLYPQRKAKSQRKLFYPTRLATILSTSNNVAIESPKSVGASKHQDGFLIVETNYRVYAYTSRFWAYSMHSWMEHVFRIPFTDRHLKFIRPVTMPIA